MRHLKIFFTGLCALWPMIPLVAYFTTPVIFDFSKTLMFIWLLMPFAFLALLCIYVIGKDIDDRRIRNKEDK